MRKEQQFTKKSLSTYKVLGVGYCGMECLLKYRDRAGYNSNYQLGWNYDVYLFPEYDLAIATGYRVPNEWWIPTSSYDDLEKRAKEIVLDYTIPYDEKKEKVEGLLESFLKEFR